MFRVKPRATLGLIFFTVLIQKYEKQWKVLSGCLKNLPTRIPAGQRPSGKSDDPRKFPRANISRQPLQTFHCLSDFWIKTVKNIRPRVTPICRLCPLDAVLSSGLCGKEWALLPVTGLTDQIIICC